jgi:hypothetical protein
VGRHLLNVSRGGLAKRGPVGSPLTPERSLDREGVLSHVAE